MKVSSVLVGREVYPLFQAGKSLSSKFYFRDEKFILCSFSGREDFLALRAKNELSSVSGRVRLA